MTTVDQTHFRQEMPPPGGYGKIFVQRTYPRIHSKLGKRVALATAIGVICGYYKYRAFNARHVRCLVEQNDVRIVMSGFLAAERDRIWLNRLRKHRNEERDLMKDVPGWRTGTFYGEPIYYTMPPEMWWDPTELEMTAHLSNYRMYRNNMWRVDADMRGGPKWYDPYLPFWLKEL